jgi:hypothetical protein
MMDSLFFNYYEGILTMNTELRLSLMNEYEAAPDSALFSQLTVAALRQCSIALIERDRWAGMGVPFLKMGHLVRYRKSDIRTWLEKHQSFQSTTQAQQVAKNLGIQHEKN